MKNRWKSKKPYFTASQVRTDERERAESSVLVLCRARRRKTKSTEECGLSWLRRWLTANACISVRMDNQLHPTRFMPLSAAFLICLSRQKDGLCWWYSHERYGELVIVAIENYDKLKFIDLFINFIIFKVRINCMCNDLNDIRKTVMLLTNSILLL